MRISRGGRAVALAAAAAVTIGGTVALTTPASANTPRWAPTATKAVHYTGTRLGATRAGLPLHIAVALTPRHGKAMNAALRAMYRPGSASYHHYLTARQWRVRYAPAPRRVGKVRRYLASQGFTGIAVTGNRMLIMANGTAARAERAFHTSLASYRLGRHVVYGNTTAARVPTELSGAVSAVIGLNDLPLTAVHPSVVRRSAAGSPSTNGLFPKQFDRTYHATHMRQGRHTPIAILTQGATRSVIRSLRYAERKEHMPRIPVTVVRVGPQSKDTAGAEEFDMDSQVSTMVAGRVPHLYMYNIGSLLDSAVVADFQTFVSQNVARAMSASIGGCEVNAYLDGSERATDLAMKEAAMQGQSLFASSGDNGDACMYVAAIGAPAGVPGVNWPASAEFTTAVGGTSLVSDAKGNRIQELAWLGSGGGISYVEYPGWWTQATDPATPAKYVTGGRAVPDIALDADPNVATPVKVYVGKTLSYIGGTSLSSPMMLGFWARLETAHRNRLGLASIPLYRVYDKVNPGTKVSDPAVIVPDPNPKPVPGFTDIVAGTNGVYPATPGYDLVTGLGAPDVRKLNRVIR